MEQDEQLLFGRRVALIRERRGLSQQELAQKARTTYQTINRLERGILKEPGIYLARRIALALSASLDFLVGIYDERDRLTAGLVLARACGQTGRASTES